MKLLLNIIIVGMFGVEICSPFMIGYLDKKEKQTKASVEYYNSRNQNKCTSVVINHKPLKKSWKKVDFSGHSYSDSKSLKIKE